MSDKNKPPQKLNLSPNTALKIKETGGNLPAGSFARALALRGVKVNVPSGPQTSNLQAVHKAAVASTQAVRGIKESSGIYFVIDCTASRHDTWAKAQEIMAQIFSALSQVPDLRIGMVIHQNNDVKDLGWFKNAQDARRVMSQIGCVAGHTRIIPSLAVAAGSSGSQIPSSIIMIGDCFEEEFDVLGMTCQDLKDRLIPIRAFHEGDDPAGEHAYRYAAEMTGGTFAKFGHGCAASLQDLCVAVAAFDAGGSSAFDLLLRSGHPGAKALQHSLKRPALGYGSRN